MLVNRRITRAGWEIERVNTVRKHLSAIKGGRLARLLPPQSVTLVLSDVRIGHPEMVGSGPTFADWSTNAEAADLLELLQEPRVSDIVEMLRDPRLPDTPKDGGTDFAVAGDTRILLESAQRAATERGYRTRVIEPEVREDVESAARALALLIPRLPARTIVIAGGEPTVVVRGGGRGGRCSEMTVRFARLASQDPASWVALFGSSDGRDGNTGAAGYVVSSQRFHQAGLPAARIDEALAASDSFPLVEKIAEPIIIPPTGNNLRDLFVLART
jgi:glycerate 2-kinase